MLKKILIKIILVTLIIYFPSQSWSLPLTSKQNRKIYLNTAENKLAFWDKLFLKKSKKEKGPLPKLKSDEEEVLVPKKVLVPKEVPVPKHEEKNEGLPIPLDEKEEEYVVGGNDVLKIVVYDEPELSKEKVRLSVDGYFNFGLIGRVRVLGLSASEIEEKLEILLKDGYILNPQVSILVEEYGSRKVFVLGAVNIPGSYELRGTTTLLEMISKAGGVKEGDKAGKKILILRKSKRGGKTITIDRKKLMDEGDLSLNVAVKNNDTIYIPAADFVFVFGEVKNPGSYELSDKNKTALSAITIAGGFTKIAAPKKTKIVRLVGGKETTIFVNIYDITKRGDKSKDIVLISEDIIIVPESLF